MHWDRLFEDLEGQLASEWENERAALDAESERLRISRLELRSRLRALCADRALATVDLPAGTRALLRLLTLGADWMAATPVEVEGALSVPSTLILPLHAIGGLSLDHGTLLASLETSAAAAVSPLRERMTLGFVLRDLARRRVAARIVTVDGRHLHGTIDRAGADHLDLALHDSGTARTARAVRGFRMLPFAALASVQTTGDQVP